MALDVAADGVDGLEAHYSTVVMVTSRRVVKTLSDLRDSLSVISLCKSQSVVKAEWKGI